MWHNLLDFYPHGHLGFFEMGIHGGIDADDGAGDDGAILEFDGDLLTVEFLEEFY